MMAASPTPLDEDRMSIVDDVREDIQTIPDAAAPWWRVVRADGAPATCHGGRARALLIEEGVPFDASGRRVDMDRARYSGAGAGPPRRSNV